VNKTAKPQKSKTINQKLVSKVKKDIPVRQQKNWNPPQTTGSGIDEELWYFCIRKCHANFKRNELNSIVC
jgi:hypothetical protein